MPWVAGRSVTIGVAVALAYLTLATSLAFDRAAPDYSALRHWVPSPLRVESSAHRALTFRNAGIPGSALVDAEDVVRRDPLNPVGAGLLGLGRLAKGDGPGAEAAFRVSGALGWREAATQVYWFQRAFATADYRVAALRFSAIARQWPSAAAVDGLGATLQSTPLGSAALIGRLTSGEPWVGQFAKPQANEDLGRQQGRTDVLIAAAAQGLRLDCAAVSPMVQTLFAPDPQRSATLWRSFCRKPGDSNLVHDSGFEQTDAQLRRTVFEWGLPGNGTVDSAVIRKAADNRAVRVSNTGLLKALVVEQALALDPGTYELHLSSNASSASDGSRISAALACSTNYEQAQPKPTIWRPGSHRAVLTFAGGCPLPQLQIWLAPGAATIELDNASLQPR